MLDCSGGQGSMSQGAALAFSATTLIPVTRTVTPGRLKPAAHKAAGFAFSTYR